MGTTSGDRSILEVEALRHRVIECCYWYYVKSQPLLPDPEFDMLFKKLQKLEEIHGSVPDSPTQMIYGDQESQYTKFMDVIRVGQSSEIPSTVSFDTAKIVLSWTCNMSCSYCCNKQKELRDTFSPINQSNLSKLPHRDFELTGGEVTVPQTFSLLCEILRNWLPKGRNYYVYSNGLWFKKQLAECLHRLGVKGINIGVHIGEVCNFLGNPLFEPTIVKDYDWGSLVAVHKIVPIRLWVQDIDYKPWMERLGFEKIVIWKLGDCAVINTDRFFLK